MTALPTKYAWLAKEGAPKMLMQAVSLYGVYEYAGAGNNPVILQWAKDAKITGYSADSIPWCGLFVGYCAYKAGWPLPVNPLYALNWAKWGNARPAKEGAKLGDVLVFRRSGGGHVALYVGEDSTHYHILGGNQSDKVCIVRRAKTPIEAIRQAPWKIAQPANVRKVLLTSSGTPVSGSEA